MNSIKLIGCISLLFAGVWVKAAGNKEGIDLYQSGMYDVSKMYFLKNLEVVAPEQKMEAYYYLGENYVALGQPDSARIYYEKGIEVQPEYPYNYIGIGKLTLKKDAKKAEDIFEEALKIKGYKKNVRLRLALAQAYFYTGDREKAMEYIQQAKEYDSKSGLPYLLEGDVLAKEGNIGDACAKYDMALYFSPDCIGAYMKLAQLYMATNSSFSMESLNRVKEMAPDFCGTYCLLGELYEMSGAYSDAAKYYAEFIRYGYYDTSHLLRYAGILYFNKQYEEMLPVINSVLKELSDNKVAKRLYAYCLSKLEPDANGINAIRHFIETTPENECIAQDFLCYAEQLVLVERYDDALSYYEKALLKDETKRDLYREMMDISIKMKQPDRAMRYYQKYTEETENSEPGDVLRLGKCFYNVACRDSVTDSRNRELMVADSLFGVVSVEVPQSYVGYFWRARVNSMLDPETEKGLARPYYEKVIEIALEQPERNKKELIESYKYLGYYYYLQADAITAKNNGNPLPAKAEYDTAKSYFSKVIGIDPADEIASQALKQIK
ncbi:tetratricopeptide repeat protein [uncultured Sanguibacteroides sp.]|uniref:tetratricopeptide repeat protein n=1 Tax=uncultured Sanguibacteroides sp. TaxID=1635151 RepID=UPI0025E65CE5|nr:tetratricopeptide repeat protein [uncultured Sanguibacteroides sp.]